jgi:hypothetical protein
LSTVQSIYQEKELRLNQNLTFEIQQERI